MARGNESVLQKNYVATQGPFLLKGGKYAISIIAGTIDGSNTVELMYLGPDGSTYISIAAGLKFTASAKFAVQDLPPGQYEFVVTGTVAGVYTQIVRIPND